MNYESKNVLVLGLGASGFAAAAGLRRRGASVVAIDASSDDDVAARAMELKANGIDAQTGVEDIPSGSFDAAIVSPGVSTSSKWFLELMKRGISTLPEFELGWQWHTGKVIAVTGTNGKSTIVKLLAEILIRSGQSAVACGNYGLPVCSAVDSQPGAVLVMELSSFQLEIAKDFRPDIGVLLNISPNHLDRHPDFESYRRCKYRLFRNQTSSDVAVIHEEWVGEALDSVGSDVRQLTFGIHDTADYQACDGKVFHKGRAVCDLSGTAFERPPLSANMAAVSAMLDALGVTDVGMISSVLGEFQPLPHRLELIAEHDGIRYINDSKATTLSATAAALCAIRGPIRLIAGGNLKETNTEFIKEILDQEAESVYLIGSSAQRLSDAWSDSVRCYVCETLDRAVELAREEAVVGDTILLSPGCASFDQFRSFEERGDQFRTLVNNVTGENRRSYRHGIEIIL